MKFSHASVARTLCLVVALATTVLSANLAVAAQCNPSTVLVDARLSTNPIWTEYVHLEQGARLSLTIKRLQDNQGNAGGADPVMRLYKAQYLGNGNYQDLGMIEVAFDDDGGEEPGAPKIVYSANETDWYIVVIHAVDAKYEGTGDLYLNDGRWRIGIRFGGTTIRTCDVTPGSAVQTLYVVPDRGNPAAPGTKDEHMGGAGHHQLILAPNGPNERGAGYAGQASNVTGAFFPNLFYNYTEPWVIVGSAADTPRLPATGVGSVAVAVNELEHDEDRDDVGLVLEEALGTCDSETTQQGLSGWDCSKFPTIDSDNDGLGDYDEIFGADNVPLRLWGADPAHKDAFWVSATGSDWYPSESAYDALWGSAALPGFLQEMYNTYIVGDSRKVGNPDGQTGIRLHFDVTSPSGDPLFVNYAGNPSITFDGGGEVKTLLYSCSGESSIIYSVEMETSRKPYFHLMCMQKATEYGGSAGVGDVVQQTGVKSSYVVSHEAGHGFGLHHGGQDGMHCKPNYLSLMSINNNEIKGNSAPFFPFFSDGSLPALDASSLCESAGFFGNDVSHLDAALSSMFDYLVDGSGGVDWNRDGAIESCGSRVRAAILDASTATGNASVLAYESLLGKDPTTVLRDATRPTLTSASIVRTAVNGERLYVFTAAANAPIAYLSASFDGTILTGEWDSGSLPVMGEGIDAVVHSTPARGEEIYGSSGIT